MKRWRPIPYGFFLGFLGYFTLRAIINLIRMGHGAWAALVVLGGTIVGAWLGRRLAPNRFVFGPLDFDGLIEATIHHDDGRVEPIVVRVRAVGGRCTVVGHSHPINLEPGAHLAVPLPAELEPRQQGNE